MRNYEQNPEGELFYRLHCISRFCRAEPDSVITCVWMDRYRHELNCEKCDRILIETMDNF